MQQSGRPSRALCAPVTAPHAETEAGPAPLLGSGSRFNYIRTMFQFEYITAALFAQYDNYHIPPGDGNISSRISTGITDASGS